MAAVTRVGEPAPDPGRLLRRSAAVNAVAGLALTLAAALGLGAALDLGAGYPAKAAAAYAAGVAVGFWFLALHAPRSRLGPANQLTLARVGLTALLAALMGETPTATTAWVALSLALAAEALDGLDGRAARRGGWASAFGARFDLETDALLVAVLSVLVWAWDRAGPWVLAAGLLRYLFVAAAWRWPWLRRPLPPSRRRQAVCVLQVLTLAVALAPVLPPAGSAGVAGAGLALLVYSFAVDVIWLARHRGGVATAPAGPPGGPGRGGR
jgi:phosphatidylglycerophosphate synthase